MLKVKIAKKESEQKDRVVESAVGLFVETKTKIDELNKVLKEQKDVLVAKARDILGEDEASTLTFSVDDDSVKISFGWDVKVENEGVLQEILGERFQDLVTTNVVFKPDGKLRAMALEDDALRECLIIKEKSPAVSIVK